jgi:hypothetical protein
MATTILWAAPADACLLRALSGGASPTSAGIDAAVATCVAEPQAPEDHSLTRVSQKELATLWSAGACRDENGMPLFGEDGKLVCEFGDSLVQQAMEGLHNRQRQQKQEETERKARRKQEETERKARQKQEETERKARQKQEETERKAHKAQEQARRALAHFAPPLPQRPAHRPMALVRAEALRQGIAEGRRHITGEDSRKRIEEREKRRREEEHKKLREDDLQRIRMEKRMHQGIHKTGLERDHWGLQYPETGAPVPDPYAPYPYAPDPDAHYDVHGEEPPSPARLPVADNEAESTEFKKLEAEHPRPIYKPYLAEPSAHHLHNMPLRSSLLAYPIR